MTWQELADFINNEMPECNKNEQATIWDAGYDNRTGGKWFDAIDIWPYDMNEEPSEDNFYSISINTENCWD